LDKTEIINKSVNATPTNSSVPSNIADALYYMSDHLPVVMKNYIDLSVGIPAITNTNNNWNGYVYEKEFKFISSKSEKSLTVTIYNLAGKKVLHQTFNDVDKIDISLNNYPKGVYVVHVDAEQQNKSFKVAIR